MIRKMFLDILVLLFMFLYDSQSVKYKTTVMDVLLLLGSKVGLSHYRSLLLSLSKMNCFCEKL